MSEDKFEKAEWNAIIQYLLEKLNQGWFAKGQI
jgi:hypothetical protein